MYSASSRSKRARRTANNRAGERQRERLLTWTGTQRHIHDEAVTESGVHDRPHVPGGPDFAISLVCLLYDGNNQALLSRFLPAVPDEMVVKKTTKTDKRAPDCRSELEQEHTLSLLLLD